jgi:hypothetical protein
MQSVGSLALALSLPEAQPPLCGIAQHTAGSRSIDYNG